MEICHGTPDTYNEKNFTTVMYKYRGPQSVVAQYQNVEWVC